MARHPRRQPLPAGAASSQPAIPGTTASQSGPVQFSLTWCVRLKTTNTPKGTNVYTRANRLRRAAASSPPSASKVFPANATPTGVSTTTTAPSSSCSENLRATSTRPTLWNANDAQWCWAFQTITGEKIATASPTLAYGAACQNHRRERGSDAKNTSVATPSRATVYFESIPNPRATPTPHHARPSSSKITRAR